MRKRILGSVLLAGAMLVSGITFNAYRAANIAGIYSETFRLCKTADQHAFVEKVFKENFSLLTVNPDHNFDVMLQKRSPNRHESKYFGKMDTVILYDNNDPVGFISYYMKKTYKGHILYLAIDQKFRRKGYARKLVSFAMDSLKKQGAKVIKICTYDFNIAAQKLYTQQFGFIKEDQDGKFIFYRKDV
ncbi:MAG: ribosomal protein S18 acetylase RimI-like enzyme [Alteromonas naphthalenivorans]|jgi:ribosomal protein S18 acetylase RimI-like enzyme